MPTCSSCGKECAFTDSNGNCFSCMTDYNKQKAKEHFEKIKKEIGLIDNGEATSRNDFEKQTEFENRMKTFVRELRKAKEEDNLEQAEEQGLNVEMKGGSGTVSLRPEDIQRERGQSGNLEFDSHEEMIDFLRSEAQKGNEEQKANLEKLWVKVVTAMREQPTKANFQYSDKDWLKKLKEAQNREWKKKLGVKNE